MADTTKFELLNLYIKRLFLTLHFRYICQKLFIPKTWITGGLLLNLHTLEPLLTH